MTTKTKTTMQAIKTTSTFVLLLALCVPFATCQREYEQHHHHHQQQQQQVGPTQTHRISSAFAARRAADDARPFKRIATRQVSLNGSARPTMAESQATAGSIVMGKFKAPAPERVQRSRIPKGNEFASQTMGASYRVADNADVAGQPEKIVHGVVGASSSSSSSGRQSIQRTVGAKIQVSDEGLNYPPSKLSADIYGNVAEIVTAPPEAVDSDFLLPHSNRFGTFNGKRR